MSLPVEGEGLSESSADQDASIGFLVREVYRPFIVSHVRCSHLLVLVPGMAGHPDTIKIQKLDRKGEYQEAAAVFLSAMEKLQAPGKWTSFLKALEDMDYEYVASVIRGAVDLDSENAAVYKNLLSEVFGHTISQSVVINDLMPGLLTEGLIDDRCKEELRACDNIHGNWEAMMFLLIGHIWRKQQNWYHRFLKVLLAAGHEELVQLIDPTEFEKIKAEVEEEEKKRLTAQRELVVSGGGPAHQPAPNLSPAPEGPSGDERETEAKREPSGALGTETHPELSDEGETTLDEVKGENHATEDHTGVKSVHCTEGDDKGEAGAEYENDLTRTSSEEADCLAENANLQLNLDSKESAAAQKTVPGATPPEEPDWSTVYVRNAHSELTNKNDLTRTSAEEADCLAENTNLQLNLDSKESAAAQKTVPGATPPEEPEKCIRYNSGELRKLDTPGCKGDIVKSIPQDILELCPTCQDEAEGCGERLELRHYQQELAEVALQGRNVIICAPTNTGKTIVAIKIIQEHLKQPGIHKVAFIVDKVALAGQQFQRCQQYLSPETRIKKMVGEAQVSSMPLGTVLQQRDVVIMTAQILINALKDRDSGIRGLQDLTLLIFDECHHTMDNHPYNQVMVRYFDQLKLANPEVPNRPQVVGLTASVGVGKARSEAAALQHVKHLCANMDAVGVVTVRRNKEELAKHTNIPPTETINVPPRALDEFRKITDSIMTSIEVSLQQSKYFAGFPSTMQRHLKSAPRQNRAEDQYVQWLSMLEKLAAELEDNDARRLIFACHEQLKAYNSALMLNEDCRTQDAMKFLKTKFEQIKRQASIGKSTEEETRLLEIFDKHSSQLKSADKHTINPKLTALKKIILESFSKQEDSRAILFVKTRELTVALVQWMQDTAELQPLKAAFFTGAQAATDRGGMTQHQQADVLTRFRAGEIRILVATSVAQEGLDISSCNLVISYGYFTNVIGMMQIRGRARQADSRFANVGSARSGLQDNAMVTAMQEKLMMKVLEELHDLQQQDPLTFQAHLARLQQQDHVDRRHKESQRLEMLQNTEEYEVMCQCGEFVCMSSDIRVIHDCHHVAISEDFMDGAMVKQWSEPLAFKEVEFNGRVYCLRCGQDWGSMMRFKNVDFPTIKIAKVMYRSSRGITNKKKKWKDVPFGKIALSLDDQMMLVARMRGTSPE